MLEQVPSPLLPRLEEFPPRDCPPLALAEEPPEMLEPPELPLEWPSPVVLAKKAECWEDSDPVMSSSNMRAEHAHQDVLVLLRHTDEGKNQ